MSSSPSPRSGNCGSSTTGGDSTGRWRLRRPTATELFEQEFASATDTLATHPGVGASVRRRRVKGLRRFLLRATRYHVYYVATDRVVFVLAVWSAVRGSAPPISQLSPPE